MKSVLKFAFNVFVGALIINFVLPNITGISFTGGYLAALGISTVAAGVTILAVIAIMLLFQAIKLVRKGDTIDRIMAIGLLPCLFVHAGLLKLVASWFPTVFHVETWTAALVAALVVYGAASITERLGKIFDKRNWTPKIRPLAKVVRCF